MIANFALSLSFDGLRLMHRVQGGWHLVGQVALDDPDLTGALGRLKDAADTLDPSGLRTKLLIPNDQIKYIAIDTTRAEDEQVREALHGATPYAVEDLAYDFAKGGGRTYVAAVAKETLDEARQFAAEHGFNPVSFAAVPEPFTYVGEAFFGATEGNTAERDPEPVIVIGDADVEIAAPIAEPTPAEPEPVEPEPVESATVEPEPAPEPIVEDAPEPTPVPEPQLSFEDNTPEDIAAPTPEPETPAGPDIVEDEIVTPEPVIVEPVIVEPDVVESNVDASEAIEPTEAPTPDAPEKPTAEAEPEAETPMFSSRLRADRNEGRPAPAAEPTPDAKPSRAEPTFSRQTPPTLAVPTGSGTDAMPPLSAPSRDATDAPKAPILNADTPLSTEAPAPDVAPPVTGEAPTALPPEKLPPEVAIAASSLAIDPEPQDAAPESEQRSAAATAIGAATAVTGAVGAAFASRRMARAEAKTNAAETAKDAPAATAKPDEKSRLTVFGARKQAKPKAVVGGKPRFLGLILTAVLLLFLLAFAALAALSEEGIASWFGFGNSETQIAETPTDPAAQTPTASEVAGLQPTDVADPIDAAAALIPLTAPEGGQVLTPEEATRVYATTGVWQRAPRIPQTSRTTSLETMALGTSPRPVVRVPPSPLASASSVAGDALIATPIDPPAPDATFNFGADGLIVASEQGTLTPDGILIIAGTPSLNPPTRPGTVAPEITPQDQLAAVVPDTAEILPDAPEGVIVIAGRPAIEPPVRTGTPAPVLLSETSPATETSALATGTAPLLANDGLLVLAGSPPILPPVRPGTTPPSVTPVAVIETPTLSPDAPETPALTAPIALENLPEGLNVIAGSPPILPPSRPGTLAPQNGAALGTLTSDITAALDASTAQTPSTDTRRPLVRPAAITQAAVAAAAATAPIVGDLTASAAAAFRPRTRPAGLAPITPEVVPDPEPEVVAQPTTAPAPTGLQIAPEIAAAVQAAANRPNPIVNPTRQAVPVSSRPDTRPRNMARIVDRANQANQRAAAQVASVAPRTVAPSGPTGSAVAQNATLDNAINLRDVNLIGIYGGASDRRALVRLANGRYVRVTVGDRLDGGRVTAISSGALNYTKRGRAVTLQVAG